MSINNLASLNFPNFMGMGMVFESLVGLDGVRNGNVGDLKVSNGGGISLLRLILIAWVLFWVRPCLVF
jgi:hypothetical protein